MNDAELLAAFANHQQQQNRKRRTIIVYRSYFRSFAMTLGDRSLLEATADDIEAYVKAHCVAARSRYQYLSRFQTLYRFAIDQGWLDKDPAVKIPRPTLPRGLPRPISSEDLSIAIQTADLRVKSMILLGALAGLRCQEIAGIDVSDLLLHTEVPMLLVTHPKGWQERTVPLHTQIIDALADYGLPRTGPIYPHTLIPGEPIGPYTASRLINEHLHGLGITSTAHTLRHYFGTQLYLECHDIRLVAAMLGHQDLATATVYAAYSQSEAAAAISALSA